MWLGFEHNFLILVACYTTIPNHNILRPFELNAESRYKDCNQHSFIMYQLLTTFRTWVTFHNHYLPIPRIPQTHKRKNTPLHSFHTFLHMFHTISLWSSCTDLMLEFITIRARCCLAQKSVFLNEWKR